MVSVVLIAKEPPGPPSRADRVIGVNLFDPNTRGEFDVYDYLDETDDLDLWWLDTGSGTIDITLSFFSYCETCDFDLYLYSDCDLDGDGYLDIITYSNEEGNVDESISQAITSGRYLIGVYSFYGAGSYHLFGSYPDPSTELPDLVIQSFWVDNADPEIGQSVTITIVVQNQGTGNLYDTGFYIDLYFNPASPPQPGENGDVYWAICGLDAGATVTKSHTVSETSPGYWHSYAQVDGDEWITESNEGNNVDGPIDIAWHETETLNNYGWPILSQSSPHNVNSVLDEYRPGKFHNGIDIQATMETDVYSISSGVLTTWGDGMRVGNFAYEHLTSFNPDLPPENKWVTHAGFRLAETDAENHVHFIDGPLYDYVNPLRDDGITPSYVDNMYPQIGELIIRKHGTTEVLEHEHVRDQIDFIVQVKDHIWTSGNRNGIYKLGYEIVGQGQQVNSYQFDRWLSNTYHSLVFPQAPEANPGYIYYNVTNHMVGDNTVVEGFWDSNSVVDGTYQVRITTEDKAGNTTPLNFTITVDNSAELR